MIESNIQKIIGKEILTITSKTKSPHVASNLSIVDILVVMYKYFVKKNNKNKFILSKGHACLSLYCVLYLFKYFSKKTLYTFSKNKSKLMSHASHKVKGVIFSTGSLGHGLPFAAGKAYINKKDNIYCLVSDGEINEGSNWEALMFIGYHKLNNIKIILDYNKIQSINTVKKVLNLEPLSKKFQSFGCKVLNIDGHNFNKIFKALSSNSSKPLVIVAHTVKGKGVSFMENSVLWHYKSLDVKNYQDAMRLVK